MAKLFPDPSKFTPQEIEDILNGECEKKEFFDFKRAYTPDELSEMKDQLPERLIEIDQQQEELKRVKQEAIAAIKANQAESWKLVTRIRKGYDEVNEELYAVADQDEGVMDHYDKNGIIQFSRKLLPHERQLRLTHKVTGTNNE
jgi:DNA-binding transcriptional MerR regulator